jgi:hypothetical protein
MIANPEDPQSVVPLPGVDGYYIDELAGNIADRIVRRLNYGGPSVADGTGLTAAGGAGAGSDAECQSDLVFMLSAFTPDMDPAYHAVAAAATEVGLRAERVKDVKGDFRITEQILDMIKRARLIVADLTNDRPNVYFELGYARGIGKKVITILRSGSQPHFDVYDWAYLEYIDSRPLEKDLLELFRLELRGG